MIDALSVDATLLLPIAEDDGGRPEPISHQRLLDLLHYCPTTGVFHWRVNKGRARAGKVAGTDAGAGYLTIYADGRHYKAHRLAWLYVHGTWPAGEIDHRNMVRSDNRIENLRDATRGQNGSNKRRATRNKSGFKGVFRHKNRWCAEVQKDGVKIYLGRFVSIEEARAAYVKAALATHGDFARIA